MGLIIGIDVGGSTTKIVGLDHDTIKSPMFITAADPVTSLFGAFGKYVYDNGFKLSDIEQVMLTGVGSAYIEGPLYGLPTQKADEFVSDGLGARYNTNLKDLMVVSMGTGTSYVKVTGKSIKHIGGISIGGGTLQGLSLLLLKTRDFAKICELAEQGDVSHINLHLKALLFVYSQVRGGRPLRRYSLWIRRKNSASSMTGVPSSLALVSLLPAFSPART